MRNAFYFIIVAVIFVSCTSRHGGNQYFDDNDIELVKDIDSITTRYRNSDSVRFHLNQAKEAAHRLGDASSEIHALDILYWSYYFDDKIRNAYECASEAYNIADSSNNQRLKAKSAQSLGIIFSKMKQTSLANKNLDNAIRIFSELKDTFWVCTTIRDMAKNNYLSSLYDSAQANLKRAYDLDVIRHDTAGISIDYAYLGALNLYKYKARIINSDTTILGEALRYCEKALSIYKRSDDYGYELARASVESNLPELYILKAQTEPKNSEKYREMLALCRSRLQRARDMSYAEHDIEQELRLNRVEIQLLIGEGKIDEAEKLANYCYDNINIDRHSYIRTENAYNLLALVYEAKGDAANALKHLKLAELQRNMTVAATKNVQLSVMMARGQYESELMKAKGRENELRAKSYMRGFLIVMLAIIVVVMLLNGFILKRNYKRTRKLNQLVTEQNKQITEGLDYASMIQNATMPSEKRISKIFGDHMAIYHPLNIVSGDFYWAATVDRFKILVVGDCTGHGVPGALLSMLGMSILEYTVKTSTDGEIVASQILDEMRETFKHTLNQKNYSVLENVDSIDISLAIFDIQNMKMQYAGAFRPVVIFRNGEVIRTKGDLMPIGTYYRELDHFTNHVFDIEADDVIYMYSDGFTDQFGYNKNQQLETFKTKRLLEMLRKIHLMAFDEQKQLIEEQMLRWRTSATSPEKVCEQTDDAVLVGVSVRNMMQ